MRKKTAVFLLAIAFLTATAGAVALVHHHDDGPHHDCQTCHLIKLVAWTVATCFLLLTLDQSRRRTTRVPPSVAVLQAYLTSASPRGPPAL